MKNILLGLGFVCCTLISYAQDYKTLYEHLPFEMPEVNRPVFPDREMVITGFGGVGDGITLNTTAFEKAISALAQAGGGTLRVPAGVWLTGPIILRSNINLHIEKGALLLFTPDPAAYPLVESVYEGWKTKRCQSPISGNNIENIAITGEGTINGSGEAWRPLKKSKVTEAYWKKVVASGGYVTKGNVWVPDKAAFRLDSLRKVTGKPLSEEEWEIIKVQLRPVMVNLVNCKNVLLQGVLFENSPAWNIHPLLCENVIVDGVFIRNPSFAQNGDGLDLESCRNVIVVNSTLDVGDDAICLKSGKDAEGRKRGRPTENVIVDNCKVFKGHGGFVVGSEMSGGVKNVMVKNCTFLGTDIGLRFKSCRGRGGVVENIYADHITMYDIVHDSFLFDLYYGSKSPEESVPAVTEATPAFRNIYVSNLISRRAGKAMFFNGLPEMNIQNVNVENAEISAAAGAELVESDGIILKNVRILPDHGPALLLKNAKNLRLSGFSYPETLKQAVEIQGEKTRNIHLPQALTEKDVKIGQEVKLKEIIK